MSLPDGTTTLVAAILSLSPVAYYRGPLSGGDILYFFDLPKLSAPSTIHLRL
jgi:hypothetical protein